MEILYFILELKTIKMKKMVFWRFRQICNKKNIPLMQLRCWQLTETNSKSENFRVIGLVIFQQLRKLWLESKEGSKFVLFLSLFSSVHINFRRKMNSHSLFIIIINLFFLLLYSFFLICKFTTFFNFSLHI